MVVLGAIILCFSFDCEEFVSFVRVKTGAGQILDNELHPGFFQGQNK